MFFFSNHVVYFPNNTIWSEVRIEFKNIIVINNIWKYYYWGFAACYPKISPYNFRGNYSLRNLAFLFHCFVFLLIWKQSGRASLFQNPLPTFLHSPPYLSWQLLYVFIISIWGNHIHRVYKLMSFSVNFSFGPAGCL